KAPPPARAAAGRASGALRMYAKAPPAPSARGPTRRRTAATGCEHLVEMGATTYTRRPVVTTAPTQQPAGADDPLAPFSEPVRAARQHRQPDRRHPGRSAARPRPPAAGHPRHDAGVALPHPHERRPRDPPPRRARHRGRGPRHGGDEARRPPRAEPRAARPPPATGASARQADRPP